MKAENLNLSDVPAGLGMALAQNSAALTRFAALSDTARAGIISAARNVQSRQEMRALVGSIARGEQPGGLS